MVGKRINNLPSVSDYTDEDYLIVEQESGTRKGTFKQVTDTIVKKLAEDDTLSSNLITSSGAISALGNANGKPMSGSFYVDNGYKLIAPEYDNDNNRVENTESAYVPTLIDIHYNYNSNYTASRYPNFWTIGNTDLDLNINAKDNTYISSNVKCDGNLDVCGGTLKLNCKTNGSNNITGVDFFANQFNFLSNTKNGRMNEIHLGDANAKLNVYSMEEPTFYDSSKMQTYKFLTEGNIANTRINGIWLNEAGGAIYGGTNTGSDGSSVVPLYKILEVANNGTITLGSSQYNTLNINCRATMFGKELVTKDQLSNLPGGSSNIISASGNADGNPMSGSFYVDNGYKLIAPSYDNNNNRVENAESELISVQYNYNSSNTASRYPNSLDIGDRNLYLYLYGKSINLSGTVYGNCSGAVIRTISHGSGPGEIIIGNYDSASAPSLTLEGSSVNAKYLTITDLGHLALDGDACIYSGSDNVSLLRYNSGVLHVGASNKKVRLDCTEASVNGHKILTEDNYGGYINSDVTYVAVTYDPKSSELTSGGYNANNCLIKSNDYTCDILKFIPPVAGIYEISMSTFSHGATSSKLVNYNIGNQQQDTVIIIDTVDNSTDDIYRQISGKTIFKCTSTSDTKHIIEYNPSKVPVTIVIKLIKGL